MIERVDVALILARAWKPWWGFAPSAKATRRMARLHRTWHRSQLACPWAEVAATAAVQNSTREVEDDWKVQRGR